MTFGGSAHGNTTYAGQPFFHIYIRKVSSSTSSIISTNETLINVSESPTSTLSISSTSDKVLNFAGRNVLSEGSGSTSSSIRDLSLVGEPESHLTEGRSFAYNERTSLEVVDHNINWDSENSEWYTDWFTEEKILGNEDTLAIRSLVVPDAKKPAARAKIQYDKDGSGEVDEETEPINLDDEQEVIEVPGVPADEDGFYRIKIMEYSGYNSIYSLGTAIVR